MGSRGLTQNTSNKTEDHGDIISNLPDDIIGHILSFLSTKDAVRTSVLSRSWIYKWTSITNLHLDDTDIYYEDEERAEEESLKAYLETGLYQIYAPTTEANKESFMNFVDRVLAHVNALTISSFTLFCYSLYDAYRLNSWISFILRRNVQKLYVEYPDVSIFWQSLLNCNSLQQLGLYSSLCWNFVPTSATLSNLQILKLTKAKFVSDSKELIISFPVLKVFEVAVCKCIDIQSFSIKAPLLESFDSRFLDIDPKHHEPRNLSIKIFARHLKKFFFYGELFLDIILLDFISTPLDVSISIAVGIHSVPMGPEKPPDQKVVSRAWMLLKQFHDVKYLKLGQVTVTYLTKDFAANIPTFERLIHLDIQSDILLCTWDGEVLLDLLHKAPNLKTLILQNVPSRYNSDYLTCTVMPQCFSSSLEVVEVQKCYARPHPQSHELSFAKFVMENTKVLKQLTLNLISYVHVVNEEDIAWYKEQLDSFHRSKGSSVASINLDTRGCFI